MRDKIFGAVVKTSAAHAAVAGTGEPPVRATRRRPGRGRLVAATVAVSAGALSAGLLATAVPAYADVVTSDYTIGTPSVGVTSVVASPASVVEDASTTFNVTLTASTGLSGTSDSYVTVTPSEDLASPPVNVDLVGGSCIQSGTDGAGGTGLDAVNQLTVELGSSCSISAGQSVQVFFTADAPAGAGSFDFTVTTSANATLATSNTVTVGASAATLSAASYGFGANTTYTISDIPVTNLSTSTNTVLLTPEISGGTEVLTFYNGVPGYTVSYTPSGGSAIADLVEGVNVIGDSVSLTLENAVSNGDTLNITASGTNPAANGATQSNAIEVQPGNGSAQLTSTIAFGNSITGLSVSPSTLVGGASATYTVGFRASTTAGIGGDILLSETAGPTNFSAVSGVDVRDTTLGWNYVGSAVTLSDGLAEIEVNDTINAGDAITVTLASVTNPVTGTISDFKVSTTSDPVPAVAPPYTIGANGSAGVIVSVSPATASAIATYSISNLLASAAMTGGTSDITVDAPSGTVFPASPGSYDIVDSTTASGSGTVATVASGGGTDDVVITVPGSINSGDRLALDISDVINPGIASSTYSISLLGSVTGLAPSVATTTTPPTTTKTAPQSSVTALTTQVAVSKQAVNLELRCGTAKCSGVITLVDLKTELGHSKYALAAGKTGYVEVGLFKQALTLLAGAKNHTIGVTETITVTGGKTVTKKITVTTSATPTTARPVVTTSTVTVHNKSAKLELRCSVATCVGTVTLVDVRTELGHSKYDLGAGKTGDVTLGLSKQALSLLAGAKNHTIDVTETVTVTGGKTATTPITLIG